jgi:hypothetical protein
MLDLPGTWRALLSKKSRQHPTKERGDTKINEVLQLIAYIGLAHRLCAMDRVTMWARMVHGDDRLHALQDNGAPAISHSSALQCLVCARWSTMADPAHESHDMQQVLVFLAASCEMVCQTNAFGRGCCLSTPRW